MNAKQWPCHTLVQQHGKYRNHGSFDHIQRSNTQNHKRGDAVDTAADGGTHTDNGIQGKAKELRELGQQLDGIEGAAQNRHG